MSALVDVCGWDREKQKGRGKEKGRGRKQEKNREDMFTLFLFFFFFTSRCELALVVLQADTTCCAHAISKGLVAQAY